MENKELFEVIRTEKLTPKAIAQIFCQWHGAGSAGGHIVWDAKKKSWTRDGIAITDATVLTCVFVDLGGIRNALIADWKESVFSAIVDDELPQAIVEQMNALESMASLKDILNAIVAELKKQPAFPAVSDEAPDEDSKINFDELEDQ